MIKLQKRELLGKKAKRLLRENIVPAVVYNSKGESIPVQGQFGEFVKLIANSTTTTIIDLDIDGDKRKAIIKEVETHPVTDHIRHISFFEVDDSTEMVFSVPFSLTGISPAVKNNLGVLVQVAQNVEVKAKVSALVPEIVIDISKMENPGMTISVEDLELPEGMTLVREEDSKIAIVTVTKLQKTLEVEDAEGDDSESEEEEDGAESAEGNSEAAAE